MASSWQADDAAAAAKQMHEAGWQARPDDRPADD